VRDENSNGNKIKLSSFEKVLNKTFNKESDKLKFFENFTRLLLSFIEELHKYEKLLGHLKNFFAKENLELNKEMFQNSRKLINFFNGIIRHLMLFSRLESLNSKITKELNSFNKNFTEKIKDKISSNKDLIQDLNKIKSKIFDYYKFFEKSKNLNFNKLIEFDTLKNLDTKELFEINLEEIENNRCQLCLHDLDCDLKTHLFSEEYHIICINFWVNVIDNNSPFN
jgi:hypothetical protein